MSSRKRCDLCGKWHTKVTPARDFQVCAKVEAFDGNGEELDEIQFERMDLCGACIDSCATLCREFIRKIKTKLEAQAVKEAKEAGDE